MAEKTEKATPKKLRDARKKGQVAKSQDFPSAFTFIVAIAFTLTMAGMIYNYMGGFMLSVLKLVPYINPNHADPNALKFEDLIGTLYNQGMMIILKTSAPIAGITAFVGVAVTFLIVGPVFSTEVFKFDIKKFDMIKNLKEKFKMKTLFELLKSVAKITIASILIYYTVKSSADQICATIAMSPWGTAMVFREFLLKVILQVGIFFIGVAVIDLVYQKHAFSKQMMMEKHEVKQEYKESEGDPEIKGKRKQIAQEIAYQEGPAAVKRAAAVVTNPTHIAVAIGYEPDKYAAPYIVFMGIAQLAEKMIAEAEKYGIPVMRNVELARHLFDAGKVNQFIPEDTYDAVAEVLRYVASLKEDKNGG